MQRPTSESLLVCSKTKGVRFSQTPSMPNRMCSTNRESADIRFQPVLRTEKDKTLSVDKNDQYRIKIQPSDTLSCAELDLLNPANNRLALLPISFHTVLRADQLNGNLEFFDQPEPVFSLDICV